MRTAALRRIHARRSRLAPAAQLRPGLPRLLSWPFTLLLLVSLLSVAAFSVRVAESKVRSSVLAEHVLDADLVITLTVDRTISKQDWAAGFVSNADRASLDTDVDLLQKRGEIDGLVIWSREGEPLYTDAGHAHSEVLRGADLKRALLGTPFIERHDDGSPTHEVLQLADPAGDGSYEGVVEVLLRSRSIDGAIASSNQRVRTTAFAAVALILGTMLVLRRRLRRQARLAEIDPLTGLSNRARLTRLAQLSLSSKDAEAIGATTALLMIDLEGFKRVTDAFGHVMGDQVLVEVAHRFRAALDDPPALVRLGGDEFALLVVGPAEDIDAISAVTANRVIDALHDPITTGSISVQMGASIGYAVRDAGTSLSELLRRADVAMYQAKREHVGHRGYSTDRDDGDVEGVALLGEVRAAIEHGEFFLEYQPKVDRAGRMVGVEALVRWNHSTLGLLPPARFIPLIEATTLMKPLTIDVLARAISQAAQWRKAGSEIPVSVNVSPSTLLDAEFLQVVDDALRGAHLPPACLTIELTETAILDDPARAKVVVTELRARGIGVAVDDFGVGYTSLKYLATIPFSELKLDKTFIDAMFDDSGNGIAIVSNTINLAHDLGIPVTAEGVETDHARAELTEMGCDEFQGYLFARPMTADQISGWAASGAHLAGSR